MAMSDRSNQRKPSGPGAPVSSGRLRFVVLAATVAAFLLVPAAQAAAGTLKVNVTGPGSGEVTSESEFIFDKGSPPIECSYASPGPATGTCENTMSVNENSDEVVNFLSIAGAGSEVGSVIINKGEDETVEVWGPEYGCNERATQEGEFEEFLGGWLCMVRGVGGSPSAEVTVCFVLEGEGEAGCEEAVGPPLTLIITEGSGTVTSTPAGLSCTGTAPHECTTEAVPAGAVSLVATPASGYIFGAWSGCVTHVGLTCGITLSAESKAVKIKFVKAPTLTVTKAGTGIGKIGALGISCDESCSSASSQIKEGTSVTVKAAPTKGSTGPVFEGGTGSASGCSGEVCTFPITENSSVKVKFTPISTKALTLSLTGPAFNKGKVKGKAFVKGLVKSSFGCGSGCTTTTESFFSTDEVELEAAALTGYTFEGWNVEGGSAGNCTGKTTPCKLKTDANKTIKAEFK